MPIPTSHRATPTERARLGVAWRRTQTSYPQPSIAAQATAARRSADHEPEYYRWLAEARGWVADTITCPKCHGSKRAALVAEPIGLGRRAQARWRRARQAMGRPAYLTWDDCGPCPLCAATGRVSCEPRPDVERAQAHVAAQRERLERIARQAVDVARWRLLVMGATPLRYWRGERTDLLTYQGRTIFLGTAARGGGYDRKANPHDLALIIEPGRAPSEAEVCRMVEELVADTLPLALAA